MRKTHQYFTYMQSSPNNTMLYVGVTNSVVRRSKEHKDGFTSSWAQKYQCRKLVWYEEFQYIRDAIAREKQIKRWGRAKKEKLINDTNPQWNDLAKDWYYF
jgi:putative endonuclease